MNGYPVIVFVEGDFDCLVLCATGDIASAWASGARYGARKYAGAGFYAVALGRVWSSGQGKLVLDDLLHEDDANIAADQRAKACEALERANSMPFPPLVTIVK